jgi:AcrR family transcriptional regulator
VASVNTGETTRRAAILAATVQEVVKNGFDGMSIQQIAETAGVSSGLVMYHFKTKEDLVNAAWIESIRHFGDRITEAAGGPRDSHERMDDAFRVLFVDRDEATAPWDLWLELWAKAARSPKLRDLHAEQLATLRRHYTQQIKSGIESGEFRPDLDPELAGDMVHTLIYGLAVKVTLDSALIPPEKAMKIGQQAIDLLRVKPRHGRDG